jgi:hypothetical protein
MSGKTCSLWANENRTNLLDSGAWHHDDPIEDTMFPERSIIAAENYCRSPTNDRYLWCYTEFDPFKPYAFEECDIISKYVYLILLNSGLLINKA